MIFSEYKSVFRKQLDIINGIRTDLSMITDPDIKSFLEKGWSSDPSARPTFDEILEEIIDDRYKNYFGISQSEFDKYMSQFNDDILDRNTSSKLVSELKKKVRSGDSESMFRLALIYDLGESGIKVDKKKAIDLYRMACENNNADAMLVYGKKLLKSTKKKLLKFTKKFADMHNMKAMNNFGLMLLYGNGINKNEKLAEKILERSC